MSFVGGRLQLQAGRLFHQWGEVSHLWTLAISQNIISQILMSQIVWSQIHTVLHKTELNSNPKFTYSIFHHHHYHHHHHQDPPQAIGSRLAAILANDSPEQEPVCRHDQTFHDPVGLYVTDILSLWPITRYREFEYIASSFFKFSCFEWDPMIITIIIFLFNSSWF